MYILNLTQHDATPDQSKAGVVEPDSETKARIRELLTFEEIPTREEIERRAAALATIAMKHDMDAIMIGGAPYLMGALEQELRRRGLRPHYAFSRRESVEKKLPDGSVQKTAVFRFLGFVEV